MTITYEIIICQNENVFLLFYFLFFDLIDFLKKYYNTLHAK